VTNTITATATSAIATTRTGARASSVPRKTAASALGCSSNGSVWTRISRTNDTELRRLVPPCSLPLAVLITMDYGKGWGDPAKYGVPAGWQFVGPDRERKQYFYLCCKECGGEQSFIKYQLGETHSCWECWLVDSVLRRPRLWTRLAPLIGALMPMNGRSEVEELEHLYALPDPR
jgi:hypothetical protein